MPIYIQLIVLCKGRRGEGAGEEKGKEEMGDGQDAEGRGGKERMEVNGIFCLSLYTELASI